ncbi:MAG: hypothetical protein K2P49_12305 [Oscillospiraceae bacterium]|nr:hypothetical protein [Oscillospiraceae bacterium]
MSERFSKLFALPESLYCAGAPVMIAAGAIQKDNETGRVFGQLKLRNIQDKEIKAVKVSLSPFDTAGKPLGGPIEHQYLDLSAPRDGEFGTKSAIKLADAGTRAFTVSVAEVVFADGSVWAGADGAWESLTPPAPLEEVLEDAELVKQYRLKYGQDCKYQTKRERDLWLCACGAVNREGERLCHCCGKDPAILSGADLPELREERDQRLAEESKRAAEAKAAAEVQAKRMKKIALIAAPILLVVIIAGVLFSDYTKKNDAYSAAAALLEEREFDDAMDAFAELGGFKDSKEMAEQGVAYEKALYLIQCAEEEDKAGLKVSSKIKGEVKTEEDEDGNKPNSAAPAQEGTTAGSESRPSSAESSTAVKCYRKAKAILEKLNGYKDSAQKIQEVDAAIDAAILEADYQDAIALLEDQDDHPAAREAFEALGDYKDSKAYFEGFRWLRVALIEEEDEIPILYDEKGERRPEENEVRTVTEFSADKRTETIKAADTGEVLCVQEYDQYGNITRRQITGSSEVSTFAYELDENGRPVQCTETCTHYYGSDNSSISYITNNAYEYNSKGQISKLTETKTYNFDLSKGKSPTHVYVYTYQYDDRGNVSSFTVDATNYRHSSYSETRTTHSVTDYTYVYDWVYAPQAEQ